VSLEVSGVRFRYPTATQPETDLIVLEIVFNNIDYLNDKIKGFYSQTQNIELNELKLLIVQSRHNQDCNTMRMSRV
jgi:hypothetical protein